MMLGFGLLVLLLLGGVILVLVAGGTDLLQKADHTLSSDGQRRKTPRRILDERLARGEIDQHEYEAIRRQLES